MDWGSRDQNKNLQTLWKKCRKVEGKTCIVRLKLYIFSVNADVITIFWSDSIVKYKIWTGVWKKCRIKSSFYQATQRMIHSDFWLKCGRKVEMLKRYGWNVEFPKENIAQSSIKSTFFPYLQENQYLTMHKYLSMP